MTTTRRLCSWLLCVLVVYFSNQVGASSLGNHRIGESRPAPISYLEASPPISSSNPPFSSSSSGTWRSSWGSSSDDEVLEYVKLITFLCAVLSVMGCLFIIFTSIFFKKVAWMYWRFVFGLAISDLIHATSFIVSSIFVHSSDDLICTAQGAFTEMCDLVGNEYILMIAIYLCVLAGRDFSLPLFLEVFLHTALWLASFIAALFPAMHALGMSYSLSPVGWCWVDGEPWYARYIMFYWLEWVLLLALVIIYTIAAIRFRRRFVLKGGYRNIKQRAIVVKALRQTYMYPVMMYIIWIPCSVNRILEDVTGKTHAWAAYWEAAIVPLWGFFDALIFLFTANLGPDLAEWRARRNQPSEAPEVSQQDISVILATEGASVPSLAAQWKKKSKLPPPSILVDGDDLDTSVQ
ncbi:slime mold cyclic amp receptor protein [Pelomyxa schiedti]|nr:slime mold cyclic amp receptor protein [Pelomyxa schiedti]